MTIIEPTSNGNLIPGALYKFRGGHHSTAKSSAPLPCHKLKWTSNNSQDTNFPKTGCTPEVKFSTAGNRTIVLSAADAEGATGSDSVHLKVKAAPPNSAPVVTILSPDDQGVLDPNVSFNLTGTAFDPDGKSPIRYKWVVDAPSGTITLGTDTSQNGGHTTVKSWTPGTRMFPHSCGGRSVQLHLYATDADGSVGEDTITLQIRYPVC